MAENKFNNLLEHENTKMWLSQFSEKDQDIAGELLNDLIFVSTEEMINGFIEQIEQIISETQGNIAMFAIKENTGEKYFNGDEKRPSTCGRKDVGSEGIVAGYCRDLARKYKERLINHPSIKMMIKKKCRYFILIDDMNGSGERAYKFVNWIFEDRKLKSWNSFKYIKCIILTYYSTKCATDRLKKVKCIYDIKYSKYFSNDDMMGKYKGLCKKYGKFTNKPDCALGYKDAMTNIIFAHKCPNTNPAILWAENKKEWKALFPGRPEFYYKKMHKTDWEKLQGRELQKIGQKRLSKSIQVVKMDRDSKKILILLAYIAMKKRKEEILSGVLDITIPQLGILLNECMKYGWIDKKKYITPKGLNTLKTAKKQKIIFNNDIELKAEYYFPKQLRSSARTSRIIPRKGECHGC